MFLKKSLITTLLLLILLITIFPAKAETDLLDLPDTRQSTNFSCGASALQSVLMYWGIEYREGTLMELLGTTPENGTNPNDIVRVAQELGLQAELKENLTLDDLKEALEEEVPIIVAGQAWREGEELEKPWSEVWESGHYMVVIGIDEENVYIEDPSLLGSQGFIPREEFLERWHDYDVEKEYYGLGIFIKGDTPSPPPALMPVD